MVVGLLALLGAACSSAPPPPHAPPAPPPDPAAACLQGLDRRHILYDRLTDWRTPEGCAVEWAVRVKQSATQWNRSAIMTCPMSATIWDFETQVVQPAAHQFLGHAVRTMSNVGSYDCRGERGGRPERLSQHSFGRAIDITGFDLDDGTTVTVLRDWRGKGAKSEFLHQVAQGACRIFSVVITPNHNALHRDHLHLDIGPYKLCGY
jgi:hypothetical protein